MSANNFEECSDLNQYWLEEDALRSLDYDLYFSLGTRYYCDAGCKVCYIRDHLTKTKHLSNFGNNLDKLNNIWDFFDYFGVMRTNDDLYYLKHNFPNEYKWYQEHGSKFELCMTDNAIFRTLELDDIKLKHIADISISTDFLKRVGVDKVLQAVKELHERHGVRKIKYIDCGHPELFKPILDWNVANGLQNMVHHDFRTPHRDILEHEWAEYQNTWVINDDRGLMHIYRDSIHLYFDRFYFSSDDASDVTVEPFYKFDGAINVKDLLSSMLIGKQEAYNKWKKRTINKKFTEYFNATQKYIVNKEFNFIPINMYSKSSRFFYKLVEGGWMQTQYGLYKPNTGSITSIISKS